MNGLTSLHAFQCSISRRQAGMIASWHLPRSGAHFCGCVHIRSLLKKQPDCINMAANGTIQKGGCSLLRTQAMYVCVRMKSKMRRNGPYLPKWQALQ